MENALGAADLSQHTHVPVRDEGIYEGNLVREHVPQTAGTWVREEDGTTITLRMKGGFPTAVTWI